MLAAAKLLKLSAAASAALITSGAGFLASATHTPSAPHPVSVSRAAAPAGFFSGCRDQFAGQIPPVGVVGSYLRDLCFSSFAVLYSGETKTPVYVVERLSQARLADAKDEKRTDRFYEEARVPSAERALLSDYRGSGFDRGHMAPAADMPNPDAMAQSFSLANMVPQAPENNRGVWAHRVEAATRHYVERAQGDVFVYTGPVFKGSHKTIGAGKVWVPSHLFKLVYDPSAQRAWAYWVENSDAAKVSKPISYHELTQNIGFDLLPGVSIRN